MSFQSSTLPPSMHRKLAEEGSWCMQNNQLTTKSHPEFEDNSSRYQGMVWNFHVCVRLAEACTKPYHCKFGVTNSGGNHHKFLLKQIWRVHKRSDCDESVCCTYICSTWVMMHQITRKLSKMPEDVKGEISPYFLERYAIPEETPPVTATKLDDSAEYITSGLTVHLLLLPFWNPVTAV